VLSGLAPVGDDFHDPFQTDSVQVKNHLHQCFGAGASLRIGDVLEFTDQFAYPLDLELEISVIRHSLSGTRFV
jgi:hypothetical protein